MATKEHSQTYKQKKKSQGYVQVAVFVPEIFKEEHARYCKELADRWIKKLKGDI